MSFEAKFVEKIRENVKYTDIAVGMAHILMTGSDGAAYGQGGNMRGQLGEGGRPKVDGKNFMIDSYGNSILLPKLFPIKERVVAISAGKYHSTFLTSNNKSSHKFRHRNSPRCRKCKAEAKS